jgi:methylase of polypeptide subunit release factors
MPRDKLLLPGDRIDGETRRRLGITYTPKWVVEEMIRWAKDHGTPRRIVDAGAGRGVFTFAAAAAFPEAEVIAVEIEPNSAEHLMKAAAGSPYAARITVKKGDYLRIRKLPEITGQTLFIGNPPYVRHHLIDLDQKIQYQRLARKFGLVDNAKAGLHLHFFLQTRKLARDGDYGVFIAAAEWIHADYGAALRTLLMDGMGGLSVDTFAAAAENSVFPDVMTTAAVVCFEVGSRSNEIAFSEVYNRESFYIGKGVPHAIEKLEQAKHWSTFARGGHQPRRLHGTVQLSALFRVKRGQVTGAKHIWVHGPASPELPLQFLFPSITRAKEIIDAEGEIASGDGLRMVVNLPLDFRFLNQQDRDAVVRFREWARRRGGAKSYIARHRTKWHSVQLYNPAPILCTYMARRPPAFALNSAGVYHLNIAHGLYPRVPISTDELKALVAWLNANVSEELGRCYAGALVKFEPSDIGEIRIPPEIAPEAIRTIQREKLGSRGRFLRAVRS